MHEKQQPPLSRSHPCFGSISHPHCCSITREEQLLCSFPLWGQNYLNIFLLLLHVFFFSKRQSDRKVKLEERAGGVAFPDYLSIRHQRCDSGFSESRQAFCQHSTVVHSHSGNRQYFHSLWIFVQL